MMATYDWTLPEIVRRVQLVEDSLKRRADVDRVVNLENNAARKTDLERERDARVAADTLIESAIKDIKEDISVIKDGQKWAFRMVASTLFLTALGLFVSLVGRTP